MSPAWQVDDETVEAIVQGVAPLDERWLPLASFARHVQEVGEVPPPAPSAELVALMGGTEPLAATPATGHPHPAELASVAAPVDGPLAAAGQARHTKRRSHMPLVETALAKVAGLGLAAKVGLGASVSAAAVTTAGAAGVAPSPVSDAVRDAISTVTPVELDTSSDSDVTVDGTDVDAGTDVDVNGTDAGTDVDASVDPGDADADVEADVDVPAAGDGSVDVEVDVDTEGLPLPEVDVPEVSVPTTIELPELPDPPALPVPTTLPGGVPSPPSGGGASGSGSSSVGGSVSR